MFSYILFSAGKSVRLRQLLTDYQRFRFLLSKINLTCPHQWVSSTNCSGFSHITSHAVYL